MAKNNYGRLFIIGAATFFAGIKILELLPLSFIDAIPSSIIIPLIGGISLILVLFIAKKTGVYII